MKEKSAKKILFVSYTSFIQKFYQSLLQEIVKLSGAEMKLLVPPYWKELWSGGKKFLEKTEDPLYDIKVGNIFFAGNLHFSIFRNQLIGLLKSFQPDIIDLEDEPFNAGSFQMVLYRNRFSPKSKIVIHASQHQYKNYPPPFNWMERYVLKSAEAILVRNTMAREVLLKKGYRGVMETVTHGVNVEAFCPQGAPKLRKELSPGGKPIIGYVGALAEHKGIRYLLEAVQGLPYIVLLVGDGPQKPELKQLARNLNVDAKFIPPSDHERVARYLNAMDIFVLPSLTRPNWIEKFGRVLIEAMACGVPVIGSDSGEITNVLGDAGVIFREADKEHLRNKIVLLLENPELRRQLSSKGRERAKKKYSWKSIAGQTIEVYKKLLN